MGGLPSGGDPTQYQLGQFGMAGAGAAALPGRTQPVIMDILRGQLQSSSAWGAASEILFQGLDAAIAFPAAIIKGIVEQLFGVFGIPVPEIGTIGDAFDALSYGLHQIPIIGDVLNFIENLLGFSLADLADAFEGISLDEPGSILRAILSVVTEVAGGAIQNVIDFIINGLTGNSGAGHPPEVLQSVLAGVGSALSTAVNAANQAADIARQVMQYVVQVVTSAEDIPIFGTIIEAVNSFAFWVLGWFGITRQSVTDTNPAVAAALGRIAALESTGTAGLEGFADHFNREDIGPDWASITGYSPLEIINNQYLKSFHTRAGRYDAKTLLTDTWHVQFTVRGLDFGPGSFYASCPDSATTDAAFVNCIALQLEHFFYGDVIRLGTITSGLGSGVLRKSIQLDAGVLKEGDVLAVEYWELYNTFYVFLNNNELAGLRWTDTGNAVDHGVGHRGIAVRTSENDTGTGFQGPGFDDMSAYDIKVT